jgi:hypothetical protein
MEKKEIKEQQNFSTSILGIPREQLPRISLKGSEVVRRQYLSHIFENVVTLRPDGVQFNNSCITRMVGIENIYLMIKRNDRWLIVKACEEDDCDAQRWCVIKEGKRKSRKITGRPFADRIYRMMGWNKGYYFKVCGTPALQIDKEDEVLMVFELDEAEKYPMTTKCREKAGVDDEEVGKEELRLLAEIERKQEEEKKKRKAEIAAGEKNKVHKKKERFPNTWGNESFGVPFESHKAKVKVPKLDKKSDASHGISSLFGKNK